MRDVIIAVVSGALASGAIAQAPAADSPAADSKVICKRVGTTGSRLGGRRVCATRAEWDLRQREDRQELERVQRQVKPLQG